MSIYCHHSKEHQKLVLETARRLGKMWRIYLGLQKPGHQPVLRAGWTFEEKLIICVFSCVFQGQELVFQGQWAEYNISWLYFDDVLRNGLERSFIYHLISLMFSYITHIKWIFLLLRSGFLLDINSRQRYVPSKPVSRFQLRLLIHFWSVKSSN